MSREKNRIVELRRQVRIARTALEKVANGGWAEVEYIAQKALDEMRPLDQKQSLQGLLSRER